MDRQSEAYREAPIIEYDLSDATVHEPITDVAEIKLPDQFEEEKWDRGRTGPKTVQEAHELLRSRIADPKAPDSEDEADAYGDDLLR